MRSLRAALLGALLTVAAAGVGAVAVAAPAQAAPVLCDTFDSTSIQGGQYIVQNNVWGASTPQCIDVNQNGGFTVTQAGHNNATNGAPAAYPSIYAGCHWANCSTGSQLPMQASSGGFDNIETSVSMSYPSSGTFNASYDLWFDPTPRTDGQNTGAEVMIWLNRQGSVQPIGSPVGTANIAGGNWEVWFGQGGWNVISYLRTSPTTSLSFAVDEFYSDAVSRGYAQRSWYLTSVQAGFEPWIGGAGLAVNSFSYTTDGDGGGGGGDTTPPSTPQNLNVTSTTTGSISLSWNASNDNVGVDGYDVLRRQGTSGSFSEVGSTSGTTFTSSGLADDTQYQFRVVARDAAGNTSGQSNTATGTTDDGDGGPTTPPTGDDGCSVTASTQSQWPQGYVMQVTVTNTGGSPLSGWTVTATLPSGHQVVNSWNADVDAGGGSLTAGNLGWNGNLGPNQSAGWGFQGSRSGGGLPSNFTCSAS